MNALRTTRRLALALFVLSACGEGKPGKLIEDIPDPMQFRDPAAGPRAPTAKVLGVDLGATTFAEVEALTGRLGLSCKDTSIRAMMEAKRKAELDKARERGEDAVSSASWMKKKSKREGNPQVRYSCVDVDAAALPDRKRPPSKGRYLLVFDSADLPLRHVSYQRTFEDHALALADFEDAVRSLTAVFGEPTSRMGELPVADASGVVTFPPARNIEVRWDFADLVAKVTALQFGRKKVTISERVEVPHGVRPDAPHLAAAPAPAPAPAPAEPAGEVPAPAPAPAPAPEAAAEAAPAPSAP